MKKIKGFLFMLGCVLLSFCHIANAKSLKQDLLSAEDGPSAGTLNLAILNKGVDQTLRSDRGLQSDYPIIEATITHGEYKGAKLNGQLVETHLMHVQNETIKNRPRQIGTKIAYKQYKLIFTSMLMNKNASPLKITAYAIDLDTARTALRSKINEEYLKRNGSILAVSFIQSYTKSMRIEFNEKSNKNSDENEPTKIPVTINIKIKPGTHIGILFIA